ncbi:MAG: endonuclease/exonuclease/phosphatase family protein [Bdellovibrionales bacterium]|nr:endonuclease/exonuclease/phosphatase family protein [Bdellovibrionales bacterium]
MKKPWILIGIFFLSVSCTTTPYQPAPDSVSIMAYNVENLFDNQDDPGKDDETYMSKKSKQSPRHRMTCSGMSNPYYRQQCQELDWSDSKIQRKLKRIAHVILQVKKGLGPDIVILEEVENEKILEKLRKSYLQKAVYQKGILLEGPDKRGIDVAMLSRYPLVGKPILHPVQWIPDPKKNKSARPTRGILQAQFRLPTGDVLTVFGVHFPSQGNPVGYRWAAIETLRKAKQALPEDSLVVVGGDFNITAEEEGEKGLFKSLANEFYISHFEGCSQCEGTHNYRGSWSFLDALLFSKNLKTQGRWKYVPESIRVANKSIYQLNNWGAPARFQEGISQVGVSDHFPIVAEIVPVKAKVAQ